MVARPPATNKNAADEAATESGSALDATYLSAFFKALSEPDRLRVAATLTTQSLPASGIASALALPLAQVVKHLSQLETAGIVSRASDGWRFDVEALRERARTALPTPRSDAQAGAKDERTRVLAALMRDGRLLTWPAGDARKLIVLHEIAHRFEAERVYSEQQVNALLKPIFGDYTTLRRALVDYHLMNRDHGAYWRAAAPRDDESTPA